MIYDSNFAMAYVAIKDIPCNFFMQEASEVNAKSVFHFINILF